jgi:hypothetical protein
MFILESIDMQICDLDYYAPAPIEIVGGAAPRAIAFGGASANSFGYLSIAKTRSLTQTAVIPYRAASSGSATAISITSSYHYTSGILASGRATVSSLGNAQS